MHSDAAALLDDVPERLSKRQKLESGSFGNYRRYYQKRLHSSVRDPRIALLPRDWIHGKKVLDVGCNAGKVTIEIAQYLAPRRVVGVDVDGELIREANKQIRVEWSRAAPNNALLKAAEALERRKRSEPASTSEGITPISAASEPGFFPRSMSHMFGQLPLPPADLMSHVEELDEEEQRARAKPGGRGKVMPREMRLFPGNIKLKATDWLNEDIEDDRRGYDVILALSVSKWIHLNEGDKGIRDFFAKVFECLRPEGHFILEPQDWASYAKAGRKSQHLHAMYARLALRPEDFRRILLDEIGFVQVEELGTVGDKGFARSVLAFSKAGGSFL